MAEIYYFNPNIKFKADTIFSIISGETTYSQKDGYSFEILHLDNERIWVRVYRNEKLLKAINLNYIAEIEYNNGSSI